MRVKPVPPVPRTVDQLFEIREAVPLVPEPEASCCDRLIDRTAIRESDGARDWLAFLRGLGLVAEGPSGYHRTREEPDDLGTALIGGVYGAREIQGILESSGPLSAAAVFERFESIPRWERHRTPDWEGIWRERVRRLLNWLGLFGCAERDDECYYVV